MSSWNLTSWGLPLPLPSAQSLISNGVGAQEKLIICYHLLGLSEIEYVCRLVNTLLSALWYICLRITISSLCTYKRKYFNLILSPILSFSLFPSGQACTMFSRKQLPISFTGKRWIWGPCSRKYGRHCFRANGGGRRKEGKPAKAACWVA